MADAIVSTLPRSVVREDHKLEKEAEQTSTALAELRWHWTLDETNAKRVSISEYARAISRGESVVRRAAKSFAQYCANPGITIADARVRADLSEDRLAATEAVAEARGVTLETAQHKRRNETRRVYQIASERAEKNATTIEDEASKVADWIVRSEKADAKVAKERKQRLGLRYVAIEGKLARMKNLGAEVLNEAHDVELGDDEMELLRHTLASLKALLELIDLRFAGAADVDWDAELAKLDEGMPA